jgi:hypothetical protein
LIAVLNIGRAYSRNMAAEENTSVGLHWRPGSGA